MKKILLSIAAVSAIAAAALPAAASAQPHDRGHNGQDIDVGRDRVAQLDRRIDQGLHGGGLDRREAFRLKGDLRETARLQARYSRNGLTRWERQDLDRRFDRISTQIRIERRDRDYGQGYGHGPRR